MNWVYILLGVSFLLHVVLFMLMRSYNKLNARKRVKVTVVPLLEDHIERYENHVSKLEETVSKKEWDKCNKVKSPSYSSSSLIRELPLILVRQTDRICYMCNGLMDEPNKKCKSWVHPTWKRSNKRKTK